MNTLQTWNWSAAAVHATAAVLSATLLNKPQNRKVTLYRTDYNEDNQPISRVDLPAKLTQTGTVDLKYILVAFFGVTAAAHALYATDFFGRGWYSNSVLGFGWNPFRWLEYSLSAGLMIYLISIVSGTKDEVSALSNALITPGLMINGFTLERALKQNQLHTWSIGDSKKPDIDAEIIWSNLIPAWGLFAVHWYVILSNYVRVTKEAKNAGQPVDSSVQFMVYSQLFFFSMFGVIQTYQVYRWSTSHKGREEPSFVAYEKVYIVLSAVTKLLLAGTVAYALR
jgi:hypothetical protein